MMKKGIVWESIIPWIIAIVALALALILFGIIKLKGESIIGNLLDLFRFGK